MLSSVGTPCRVLILNERDPMHPKMGGAETHVSEIFGRLARRGYSVTHLASGFAGGEQSELVNDVQIERLGGLAVYYPRALAATARRTRTGEFDVVVECLNKVPFYSPVLSRAPVLALCHHLFGEVAFAQVSKPVATAVWLSERLVPLLYRSRPFVAISESSKQDLIRRGLPESNIRVSHPGVDHPATAVDTSRVRERHVVYVGRLEVYKKIDVMLRAMAKLAERFPDTRITIVGRGPELSRLQDLARELSLEERTRFTGFVSDVERDRLLSEARVCVCPSEKEGWGLTVIESNALGAPVVATDADGLRDSVRDGETGFLVGDGDVEAFAERIGRLLADDALSLRMGDAALAWSQRFDWERAADEMADAIDHARGLA